MGSKLSDTAASGDYGGDNQAIEAWDLEKQSWRRDRAVQGNKTVDVLRYTVAGGDPVAGLDPTYTAVSGLSGLDAFVDVELKRYERKWGGLIEEADRVFVLYDVTGDIRKTDLVEYGDDRYVVMEADFEAQSGRVELLTKLARSDV